MAIDRIKLSVGTEYLQERRDLGVLLGTVGVVARVASEAVKWSHGRLSI